VVSAESHERLIALFHLAHGLVAATTAVGIFLSVALLIGFKAALEKWVFPMGDGAGGGDPEFWPGIFFLGAVTVFTVGALIFTVPAIMGGIGMLKRKRWARKALLVSGALAVLNFPLGTGLAIYTYWFLLGPGRRPLREETDNMPAVA
jgi:hypothetical protein